jgi:hypothetical protein
VHLAGLDGDVDVIVGHQVAEAFGDAAQFESQRNLLPSLLLVAQREPPHGCEGFSQPSGGLDVTYCQLTWARWPTRP